MFDPLTLAVGGGMSLLGGLFGSDDDNASNYWSDINYDDVVSPEFSNWDVDSLRDFGQGSAYENYQSARGLEGRIGGILGQSYRDDIRLLRKQTADLAPTLGTTRGIIASQGGYGGASNIIANEQMRQGQGRATEAFTQGQAAASSRYQQNLANLALGAQGATTQALSGYTGALGNAQQLRGNMQGQKYTTEMDVKARIAIANAQGRSQAQQFANRAQENPWLTTGLSLLAQGFADRGQGGGGGGSEYNNSNTLSSATNSMLSGAAQGAMSGLLAQPNHVPVLASDAQRQYGWTNPVAMRDPGMPSPSYRSQTQEMKYSGANNYYYPSFTKNKTAFGGGGQFGGGGYGFDARGRMW